METQQVNAAKIIWQIITSDPVIPMSWGVDLETVKAIDNGIIFHVQGFKITGIVEIAYDDGADLFNVEITPDEKDEDEAVPIIYEGIYCDNLVSVIDEVVEKTENYERAICAEYGLALEPRPV